MVLIEISRLEPESLMFLRLPISDGVEFLITLRPLERRGLSTQTPMPPAFPAPNRSLSKMARQSITACAAASRVGAGAALGERISASSGNAASETSVISRKSLE